MYPKTMQNHSHQQLWLSWFEGSFLWLEWSLGVSNGSSRTRLQLQSPPDFLMGWNLHRSSRRGQRARRSRGTTCGFGLFGFSHVMVFRKQEASHSSPIWLKLFLHYAIMTMMKTRIASWKHPKVPKSSKSCSDSPTKCVQRKPTAVAVSNCKFVLINSPNAQNFAAKKLGPKKCISVCLKKLRAYVVFFVGSYSTSSKH